VSKKFPRISHLPWSPGGTRDDRRLLDVSGLLGATLVITEKLDGANICFCRDTVYARSHSGPVKHPAFDFLKAFHARIKTLLRPEESVFCEYCYAVHTIEYELLPSYLFAIGIRNDKSFQLSAISLQLLLTSRV
jgi:hypothetical protein